MHLEHLNLVVRDIPETLAFYKAAFPHWRIRSQGQAEWYGVQRNWVHFGDDYQYLTFNDDGTGGNRDLSGTYPQRPCNACSLGHEAKNAWPSCNDNEPDPRYAKRIACLVNSSTPAAE